jgi:hypothetical protein
VTHIDNTGHSRLIHNRTCSVTKRPSESFWAMLSREPIQRSSTLLTGLRTKGNREGRGKTSEPEGGKDVGGSDLGERKFGKNPTTCPVT